MTINRLVHAASITGVALFMMAANASASITYSTDTTATGFNGTTLDTLNNSTGVAATLHFTPDINITTGIPSNVNFGLFTLACPTCTTQVGGVGTHFNAFTFNLVISDVTDGASGQFVGTSTGGNVFHDVSQITVNWAPLQLGPGTTNALSGNFGSTIFSTTVFTGIVAPNSGENIGQSTVQGFVSSNAVPEPATLSLVGGSLLAFGLLGRKRFSRQ